MNLLISSSHLMKYIWYAHQKSNYPLNITVAMLLGKFKCQGVQIIRIIVGPTVLAIGAGGN